MYSLNQISRLGTILILLTYLSINTKAQLSGSKTGKEREQSIIDYYNKSKDTTTKIDYSDTAYLKLQAYKKSRFYNPNFYDSLSRLINLNNKQQKVRAIDERDRAIEATKLAKKNEKEAIKQKKIAEEETKKAQQQALTNYANELAYKSKIALRDGDRNMALKLANLGLLYLDSTNENLNQNLFDANYYNINNGDPCLPKCFDLVGELGAIMCVDYCPDSNCLASSTLDNEIVIWDLKKGKKKYVLPATSKSISRLYFIMNGMKLISFATDGSVIIWDLNLQKVVDNYAGSLMFVRNFSISADRNLILLEDENGILRIWKINEHKILCSIGDSTSTYKLSAFSSDNSKVVLVNKLNQISIWELSTNSELITYRGHDFITCITSSSKNSLFATSTFDGTVNVYDFSLSETVSTFSVDRMVETIQFYPDKDLLAVCCGTEIKLWDIYNKTIKCLLKSHTDPVNDFAISPIGDYIFSASMDRTIKVWDLKYDCSFESQTFNPKISDVAFVNTSEFLVHYPGGSFKLVESGISAQSQEYLINSDEPISCMNTSYGYKNVIALGLTDGTLVVFNYQTGDTIINEKKHKESVDCIAFSNDGHFIATGSYDSTLVIWDIRAKKNFLFPKKIGGIYCIRFSNISHFLAYGTDNNQVVIINLTSQQSLQIPFPKYGIIKDLQFSLTDDRLYIATSAGILAVYSFQSNGTNYLRINLGNLTALAVSYSNELLAVGNDMGITKIINLRKGIDLLTISTRTIGGVVGLYFENNNEKLIIFYTKNIWHEYNLDGQNIIASFYRTSQRYCLSYSNTVENYLSEFLNKIGNKKVLFLQKENCWQLKEFANLSFNEAYTKTGKKEICRQFLLADTLYHAANSLQPNEPLIQKDYATMLRNWADVLEANNKKSLADIKRKQANALWKEDDN